MTIHKPGSSVRQKDERADRGKSAEKAVQKVLTQWNEKTTFAFYRLPDARAARGALASLPGDFAYHCGPNAGIIEVKSTSHNYRVAKDKISQLPVLKKLDMAGARSVILILHTELNEWRCVKPSDLEIGSPSWDLSAFSLWPTAGDALISSGYFYDQR